MKKKLTGRVAYRFNKQLFSKPVLVLQVEEERVCDPQDAYGEYPVSNRTYWRDAELVDLTELGGIPVRMESVRFNSGGYTREPSNDHSTH